MCRGSIMYVGRFLSGSLAVAGLREKIAGRCGFCYEKNGRRPENLDSRERETVQAFCPAYFCHKVRLLYSLVACCGFSQHGGNAA